MKKSKRKPRGKGKKPAGTKKRPLRSKKKKAFKRKLPKSSRRKSAGKAFKRKTPPLSSYDRFTMDDTPPAIDMPRQSFPVPRQSTRLVKIVCNKCGYTARTTHK